MKGASVLFFLGIITSWASAEFFNHRPFPTYSLDNMPSTSFSCREKILGGYYADADTECQMFHICVKVAGIGIQDFRFLCPNGTAFDQDHQICADWEDIDCDATTLYYSSDNFDLYRIGSGFESKAHKYGEEEEQFALQRAETGDARINREQQTKVIDQKKAPRNYNSAPKQNFNTNNNEKEIFKSSSSSNFYNNRNNGKERDEDYDDNVNINQNQDYEQKRKIVRNKVRRPVQNQNTQNDNNRDNQSNNRNTENNRNQNSDYNRNNQNNYNRNQNNDYNRNQDNDTNKSIDYNRNQNTDYNNRNQNNGNRNYNRNENNDYNRNTQAVTQTKPPTTKFTGFVNNFAGSYEPTTSKPSSTTLNTEQYSTAINNYRNRNGQRRQQTSEITDSPVYTISTPAPFRQQQQQQQYNSPPNRSTNNGQYTSAPTRTTENYPKQSTKNFDENYDIPKVKPSTTQDYNTQYDIPKVKPAVSTAAQYNTQKTTVSQYETTKIKQNYKTTAADKTENYPSNNPKYSSSTFEKKPTTPYKQPENYHTTLSPKPFSVSNNNNFPTTFAPRTNAGYSQISQQTATYNQNRQTNQNSPTAFNSTPRSTPFTQYTPTVPKLSSTTPVSRSSRFDETQYDDGSYSSKYDYDGDRRDDEFLKTAHSQNIAASRNELQRTNTNKQQQTTQSLNQPSRTTYDVPKTYSTNKQQTTQAINHPSRTTYDVPKTYPSTPRVTNEITKTFPSTPRSSQSTEPPRTSPQPVNKKPAPRKKDYDYAYYDTGAASEPDYDIDTEIKKSTVKN